MVPAGKKAALAMLAMPVDVILAGDARSSWPMLSVQTQRRYCHAVAFGGAAPFWIDRNIQRLRSRQAIDESRKAPIQKQEETSRSSAPSIFSRTNPKLSQYTSKRPVAPFVAEATGKTPSNRVAAPRPMQLRPNQERLMQPV